MKGFTLGLLCGVGAAVVLASGLASAQRPTFQPPSSNQMGLPDGRSVLIVCTDRNGFYDGTRRATVMRPAGDRNSPDISVRCELR
jgi:hypothetical protein